jgi:hypothetical protein
MSFLEVLVMMEQNDKPREEDRPVSVQFSDGMLRVQLQDGREIATPLEWYAVLMQAVPEQQANVELSLSGIYWPDLDEDLSIAGMLRGVRPPHRKLKANESK